jgi:hypothetical protein
MLAASPGVCKNRKIVMRIVQTTRDMNPQSAAMPTPGSAVPGVRLDVYIFAEVW